MENEFEEIREVQEDISVEEALKRIRSKQKDGYKRSRAIGLSAFLLTVFAGLIAVAVLANALLAFLDKSLGAGEIRIVIYGAIAAAAISVIALILAIIAFFRRNQKKGFAVTATILAILILLGTGAGLYIYQYVFGKVNNDTAFGELSNEQLYVINPADDGELQRPSQHEKPGVSKEEIEQIIQKQEEENSDFEIEWEYLTNEDIPEEALAKMNMGEPQGKSYLTGDYEQISNFVLFGLDENGSSDSIIIFSLDRVHHKLKLISIARDSYVQIPAWGSYAKITYAYNWGDAEWAVATLNHNYSLNLTEYITVNMEQFSEIIDLVGGVEVDLDYNEAWCLRQYSNIHVGKCLLMGEAALSYSRLRESSATDNEEQRTGRQREVLTALLNKIMEKPWTDYPEFIRTCLGMCTTSLDNEQLLELCAEVVQNDYTIEQHALISYMDCWNGRLGAEQYFYVVYDLNRASDRIYRIIYEDLYVSGYIDEE